MVSFPSTLEGFSMRYLIVAVLILCCSFAQADELRDAFDQYRALIEQGKYQEAIPFVQEAVRLAETKFGKDDDDTSLYLNNLGLLYATLGDYDKAEPLLKRVLEIHEKALGPDHPRTVSIRNSLNYLSQRHGLRTWTNITGKFSREAHFVSLSDDVVEIQLATGEKKSIPLEKLSDADQEYATKTQKLLDEDAEPAEEDPFQ
jgi:tetratricopeptide (TPR) repeat protein